MEAALAFVGWCVLGGLIGSLSAAAAIVLYDAWQERDR
jgi:hypothetical protein